MRVCALYERDESSRASCILQHVFKNTGLILKYSNTHWKTVCLEFVVVVYVIFVLFYVLLVLFCLWN